MVDGSDVMTLMLNRSLNLIMKAQSPRIYYSTDKKSLRVLARTVSINASYELIYMLK